MEIKLKNNVKREPVTTITFKNNGELKKEDEGIPILINNHPIGAVAKVTEELIEGFVINKYMGLEYSEINGKRCLSGIMLGHPARDVEEEI